MTASRNKREGMKPSELLAKARACIASGEFRYTCYALNAIAGLDEYLIKNEDVLCHVNTHIKHLLGGYSTYEGWLAFIHGIRVSVEEARQARLAWIDDMIREFEKVEL
jgi:hypothetical protein